MKDASSVLRQNLREMSRTQPRLAKRLESCVEEREALPEVQLREVKAGRWVQGAAATPFFEVPYVQDHRKRKDFFYVVHGVGYPPHLFHVLRSLPKETLTVVVLEPDVELLLATLSATSVYMALPRGCRISFVVFEDRELIDEALWHNVVPVGIFPLTEALRLPHPGLMEADGPRRERLEKRFWEEVRYRVEQLGNSSEDTLIGVRHGALNTVRILQGIGTKWLLEHWGERPAVCIGSGPSLKKNVHLLQGLEDRCLLVACDTSLAPLLRRGIRPHAVVTIERNLMYDVWVPQVLEEFPDECRRILLVSQSVSEPQITGRWPGPVLIVGKMDSPADTWLVQHVLGMNLLASGMCVSHMAMNFALGLKSPAVALIGQDLAFADDGQTTHMDDAASATPDGIAKERSYTKMEVPGVLGGTVKTHQMWHYYLQIFERFLAGFEGKKVYQCTEGGAVIQGAETLPLATFLEEHVEPRALSPLAFPEELRRKDPLGEDAEGLRRRIEEAAKELDRCVEILGEMERSVQAATSPALTPDRRRPHAIRAAELLDQLHATHRALAFIGQSYTHLAGSSLARNRFLDTAERVKDWAALHQGIVDSHRVNVEFLRHWLDYMGAVCRPEVLSALEPYDVFSEEGLLGEIERLLAEVFASPNPDLLSPQALCLSDLLCRVDLLRQDPVPPEVLWNVARFLALQGRPYEARRHMERAYGLLMGSEASLETIWTFFVDWARMEGANDLIRMPQYELAFHLLDNARNLLPERADQVEEEKRRILRAQRDFLDAARGLADWDVQVRLQEFRNHAQEALENQDLPGAFRWIRRMEEGLELYPEGVLLNLVWLAKTALDCRGAVDPGIDEACEEALAFLWGIRDRLSSRGFTWIEGWLDYLRDQGLAVDVLDPQRGTGFPVVLPREGRPESEEGSLPLRHGEGMSITIESSTR